jgi:hypothetical protein
MTFAEVERLVGGLPPSVRIRRAWWANDSKVQAIARQTASWQVRTVDQAVGIVEFVRRAAARSSSGGPTATTPSATHVEAKVIDSLEVRHSGCRPSHARITRLQRGPTPLMHVAF